MWEDPSDEVISITEILKRDNYYSISFEGGCAQLDEFIPIPLTEEWLNNFGFEYKSGIEDFYVSKKLGTMIWANKKLYYPHRCVPVEYVHQLQNLYMDLTGEELILNEN